MTASVSIVKLIALLSSSSLAGENMALKLHFESPAHPCPTVTSWSASRCEQRPRAGHVQRHSCAGVVAEGVDLAGVATAGGDDETALDSHGKKRHNK